VGRPGTCAHPAIPATTRAGDGPNDTGQGDSFHSPRETTKTFGFRAGDAVRCLAGELICPFDRFFTQEKKLFFGWEVIRPNLKVSLICHSAVISITSTSGFDSKEFEVVGTDDCMFRLEDFQIEQNVSKRVYRAQRRSNNTEFLFNTRTRVATVKQRSNAMSVMNSNNKRSTVVLLACEAIQSHPYHPLELRGRWVVYEGKWRRRRVLITRVSCPVYALGITATPAGPTRIIDAFTVGR